METFTQDFTLLTATAGKGRGKKKLVLFPRGNALSEDAAGGSSIEKGNFRL